MPRNDEELDRTAVDALMDKAIQDIDPDSIPSPTLKRLIEEIRTEDNTPMLYNRYHNRHNCGR